MNMARILMLGGLAACLTFTTNAEAQTIAPAGTTTAPRAAARTDSAIVPAAQLETGSNSYTEGQARSRLEANGFSAINNMRKDDNGFWRATATYGGTAGDVVMDFQGRIAHGAGVAAIGARPGATVATPLVPTPITPMGTSRAPDGTPGNPPGTAAGRAMDRTLGTNTTGTNPAPSR